MVRSALASPWQSLQKIYREKSSLRLELVPAYPTQKRMIFAAQRMHSGSGTTVEVVVKPKGQKRGLCQNGRPPEYGKPCEVECEAVVRLVKGKSATYTIQYREERVAKQI